MYTSLQQWTESTLFWSNSCWLRLTMDQVNTLLPTPAAAGSELQVGNAVALTKTRSPCMGSHQATAHCLE